MKIVCLSLMILFGSLVLSSGQTTGGGSMATTNIIGPIPVWGTLLVYYNFYATPDSMDVYYDNTDIFSSGSISGSGQFTIPYGPGTSTSIMIVMNQANNASPTSAWQYTAEVVPEPSSFIIFGAALSGLVLLRRTRLVR